MRKKMASTAQPVEVRLAKKSPKGLFDKLTGFRPAPTGLCLHAGEEGFSWKKMICYGSWGPSPNPFF